jgi:alkanesulfonate monooxygenase SsuD/methylene tetrahydromethanopterin reductase-like flavin-dependent oxidoreductase (luciferase family)
MAPVPLSALDLSPISSGSDAGQALRNSLDLAARAEAAGYRRYWVAEHHFSDGVASVAPAVLMGLIAAATQRIRVGAGAIQVGHQTALSIVERFGLLDAVFPGRIDLGLGRSGQRKVDRGTAAGPRAAAPTAAGQPAAGQAAAGQAAGEGTSAGPRVVDGLLIPAPFDVSSVIAAPRWQAVEGLLRQPGARSPDFADLVDTVRAMLAGTYTTDDGIDLHVTPGEGAEVELWIFGSSPRQSASVAGERGLRFAANYHISPATVLDTVAAYRSAFRPSETLDEPYVLVSADVVVAPDEATARHLARPYARWVHSIRTGRGVIPFPTPAETAAAPWSAADEALVRDRVDTQFVGDPRSVARQLRILRDATGADEVLVTSVTHDHADRVRSHELLTDGCRYLAPFAYGPRPRPLPLTAALLSLTLGRADVDTHRWIAAHPRRPEPTSTVDVNANGVVRDRVL